MGELSVRRNKNISVPRYQGAAKAEKQTAAAKTQDRKSTRLNSSHS